MIAVINSSACIFLSRLGIIEEAISLFDVALKIFISVYEG